MTRSEAIGAINTMINDGFPELKQKDIWCYVVSGKKYDYYMSIGSLLLGYRLLIEREVFTFSKKAFKGCAAHELAHFVIDSQLSNSFGKHWQVKRKYLKTKDR